MMQKMILSLNTYRLCWSACIAVLFMLVAGYTFNCGDQEEHLPYVYRLLDSTLYPYDYLVNEQVNHFTVRYYFANLVAFAGKFMPVAVAVLIFQFFSLLVFSWTTGSLAVKISRSEVAFFLAPFLALIVFNRWATGGNSIMDNQFICSVPAITAGAIAVKSAFERRYTLMAVFAGIAALFQVLIGLQLFLILFLTCLGANRGSFRLKNAARSIIVFLIVSGPMLFPVLYIQFFAAKNIEPDLYAYILFQFRNAHHYLPSLFPVKDYIKNLLVFLLAVIIFLLGFYRDYRRFFIWFSGIIIGGCILYYFLFEKLNFYSAGKLQWFKSTALLTWVSCIAIACYLTSPRIISGIETRIRNYGNVLPLSIILISVLFMINAGSIHAAWSGRYQFSDEPLSDKQKMHDWIRKNTPVEAIILIPPGDDSFLCEARRSVPVAWKGIIHEPVFMLNWYQDLEMVCGDLPVNGRYPEALDQAYRVRPDSLINFDKKITYRLQDSGIEGPRIPDSIIIHREGPYVLTKFRQ